MLILDKARTLDLMVARSEQVVVPETYVAGWAPRRLAVYEPAPVAAERLAVAEPAPASAIAPAA